MSNGKILETQRTVTEEELRTSGLNFFDLVLNYRDAIVAELVALGAKKNQVRHMYKVAYLGDGERRVLILTGEAKL